MFQRRIEQLAQVAGIAILVVGCFVVLRPFLAAALFSAAMCMSTWPFYAWLRRKLGYRRTLAASVMTLLLVLAGVVPFALLATAIVDEVPKLIEWAKELIAAGPPDPPAWLTGLPLVGELIEGYWQRLAASRDELLALGRRLLDPARVFLLAVAALLGEGILQLVLAAFIGFFLYRDGDAIIAAIRRALERLAGELATPMLSTIVNTVNGVMYGIIGTALGQGIVALIGFWIAGVPGALLLAAATFLLSVVPFGAPLVSIGAAMWLFAQDSIGWGLFLLVWAVVVVASVDNIVKPVLISRGAALPLVLVALGALGGALAFGFIGIFLGPTLLAVGYRLTLEWIGHEQERALSVSSPAVIVTSSSEER